MPLVSVRLPESTKQREARQAILQGNTAHAVMVQAIESAVGCFETYDAFVINTIAARDSVYKTGKVYEGVEFAAYLRAKTVGEKVAKPRLKPFKSYIKLAT